MNNQKVVLDLNHFDRKILTNLISDQECGFWRIDSFETQILNAAMHITQSPFNIDKFPEIRSRSILNQLFLNYENNRQDLIEFAKEAIDYDGMLSPEEINQLQDPIEHQFQFQLKKLVELEYVFQSLEVGPDEEIKSIVVTKPGRIFWSHLFQGKIDADVNFLYLK